MIEIVQPTSDNKSQIHGEHDIGNRIVLSLKTNRAPKIPHNNPKIIALPRNHFKPCSLSKSAIFMVMPKSRAQRIIKKDVELIIIFFPSVIALKLTMWLSAAIE